MKNISVAIMILVFLSACKKETTLPPLPGDNSTPTLSFPITSFASTTSFTAFGDSLPDLSLNKGYRVKLNDTTGGYAAACSGIVTAITAGHGGSKSIAVKYKPNSIYSFLYAGVRNVQVHVNDSISAGTVLGKVGDAGLIEFQLIKNDNEVLCPSAKGSAGFNNAILVAISRHNAINPADSVFDACVVQSLPK